MKLLTLNTHSLIEECYESKLHIFANTIALEKPDIIALQEVNQSINASVVFPPDKFEICGNIPLKSDNHALKIYEILKDIGPDYYFTWAGIKCGYEKFDEGVATFSLQPFSHPKIIKVSKIDDYNIWKTRKCLITTHPDFVVCNTHLGWWNDAEEPFSEQWKRLNKALKPYNNPIFLMGDFNSPSHIKNEGYTMVTSSGWLDTCRLAENGSEDFTTSGTTDGWRNGLQARIDYIFTNHKTDILSYKTLFKEDPVSDHFGVMIETR